MLKKFLEHITSLKAVPHLHARLACTNCNYVIVNESLCLQSALIAFHGSYAYVVILLRTADPVIHFMLHYRPTLASRVIFNSKFVGPIT